MDNFDALVDSVTTAEPSAPPVPTSAPKASFDSLVDQVSTPDADELHASLVSAQSANPQATATRLKQAAQLGIDPELVTADAPAQIRAKLLDAHQIAKSSPATAKFLTKKTNAELAADVVAQLQEMETASKSYTPEKIKRFISDYTATGRQPAEAAQVLTVYKNAGVDLDSVIKNTIGENLKYSANAALFGFNESVYGVGQAAAENIVQPFTKLLAGTILPVDIGAQMADTFRRLRQEEKAARLSNEKARDVSSDTEGAVYSGVQSGLQQLISIPLAILSRNPELMLGGMSAQTGGQAYGEARDKGLGQIQSLTHATSQAAIEYATEKLPSVALLDGLKASKPFLSVAGNFLVKEVGGEQVATVLQDLNDWATLNPEKPFADYLNERPGAAYQTLIATIVGASIQVGAAKGIDLAVRTAFPYVAPTPQQTRFEDVARASRADQAFSTLTTLTEMAANNPTRELSSDAFHEFATAMSENPDSISEVFIDAKTFGEALAANKVTVAELQTKIPEVAAQLEEGLAIGGAVRIALPDYLTYLAPSPVAQAILPHLRVEADGLTYTESQAFFQAQKAEDQKLAEKLAVAAEPVLTREEFEAQALQEIAPVVEAAVGADAATQLASEIVADPEAQQDVAAVVKQTYEQYLDQHPNKAAVLARDVDTVHKAIIGQLQSAGRFPRHINAAYAVPLREFYTQNAKRMGLRPSQLLERLPVKFVAESLIGRGAAFDQPEQAATLADFAPRVVERILTKHNWAILTAANPNNTVLTDAENDARMAQLYEYLDANGIQYTEVMGRYGDDTKEIPSVILYNTTARQALDIGRLFDQQSVLTRDGLIYQNGDVNPSSGKVTDFTAKGVPENNYTRIPDGSVFNVDIDFGTVLKQGEHREIAGFVPQTETPEFKAWFGDSKVVDENGEPLVVYHSTTYGDFDAFSTAEQRKGMAGYGFYFSDSGGANIYADYGVNFQADRSWNGSEKKVNIMPVFLAVKNPLIVDNISEVEARYGRRDPGQFGQGRKYGGMAEDAKTAVQRDGYDGVIATEYVKRMRDGSYKVVEPGAKGAIAHPVYVVFDPTQIKSAIGNIGTFDPNNPNILYQEDSGKTLTALYLELIKKVGDDIFTHPRSDATNLEQVADDVSEGRIRSRDVSFYNEDGRSMDALSIPFFKDGQKIERDVFVTDDGEDLWINIASSEEGIGGSMVYAIVGNYAYNNDKVFIGDPDGITNAGMVRRLQNMLSLATKFGTTQFMKPHPKMLTMFKQYGLDWKVGDDQFNLQHMLQAVYNLTKSYAPDIENVTLNFETGEFEKDGKPVTDSYFDDLASESHTTGRTGAPGNRTLKISAAIGTLIRMDRSQVEKIRLASPESLRSDRSLGSVLYQQGGKVGEVSVVGHHFSREQRSILSGNYYGKGIKGAEAGRVYASEDSRLRQRLYFYVDEGKGVFPESGVGNFKHTVKLDNLYDAARNPQKFPTRNADGETDMNLFESAVLDAGFSGYYVEEGFTRQGAAVLLGEKSTGIQPEAVSKFYQSTHGWYFSQLARAIENAKTDNLLASQWKAWLTANAPKFGIKKDEMQYTGIQEWLDLQQGKISKAQIADYLNTNGVQVVDVMLGEVDDSEVESWWNDEGGANEETPYEDLTPSEQREARQRYADEVGQYAEEGGIKYAAYVVPGGENYRELLLTLPESATSPIAKQLEAIADEMNDADTTPERYAELHAKRAALDVEYMNAKGTQFLSAHWEQPNILAHVRFDERVDADGNRVLFINEIQSDWGQKGKKEGFKSGEFKGKVPDVTARRMTGNEFVQERGMPAAAAAMWLEGRNAIKRDLGEKESSLDDTITVVFEDGTPKVVKDGAVDPERAKENYLRGYEAMVREQRRLFDQKESGKLPSAPFVTDTKAWVALALKRMIAYAAENNFDKVAIISGQQAADLYDLSKSIGSVEAKDYAGGVTLNVFGLDGRYLQGKHFDTYDDAGVEDYIGKDMARKIAEDRAAVETPAGDYMKNYSGLDLKVGGEGMRAFYDKIVPQVANDVLKKIGGGKVESLTLPGDRENDAAHSIEQYAGEFHAMVGKEEANFKTWQEANTWINEKLKTVQLGFTITPEMKAKVADGLPLFQQNLGSFDPNSLTVSLLNGANLSTVLHESGHFYLRALELMSAMPEATQEMKDDFDATLKWFGIADRATWAAMSVDQQRPYHEQWAQSQERWMLEGKSPSLEMQPIFARFRAWLLNVYKSVELFLQANPLAGNLNDEIRGVFSRLIASEEAIGQAESARNYTLLFNTEEEAKAQGVPSSEYREYVKQYQAAHDDSVEALQQRSLRDMKWLSNAKSKAVRALQRTAASLRKGIREETAKAVLMEPINLARDFLRTGETTDPNTGDQIKLEKGYKLNTEALQAMYPISALGNPDVSKLRGMTSPEGLDPEIVAQMFGFPSGDALVRELIDGENPKDKIEGLTDQRMLEEHGELVDQRAIEEAANEAVHNDARARFMATGLKMLTKSPISSYQLSKAAQEAAENAVAKKRVRDLRPGQYTAAETRANKEVLAKVATDPKKAADAQRTALLNNRLAKATLEAQAEVKKLVKYVSKFRNEGTRKALDLEYLEQIDQLLAAFDANPSTTLRELDQKQSLAAWVAEHEKMSYEPTLDPEKLAEQKRTHYKEMTVEELRGFVDAIKEIEHYGRQKKKLLTALDARAFAERMAEADASIRENANRTVPERGTPHDVVGSVGKFGRGIAANHRKFSSFLREMDASRDNGVMWNLLGRTMNDAGARETEMRAEANAKVAALFEPIRKDISKTIVPGNLYARKMVVPGTNLSMTLEERIMFALNMGNEGNLQRLLDGGITGVKAISQADARAVLNTLTKEQLDFVQGIWDYFDTFRPAVAELERELTGKTPQWVEPLPLATEHGTYRGGYFPAKYDAMLSTRSESLEAATNLRQGMKGAFGAAAARNGYTKERSAQVVGRPLLLSFNAISQHVNEVTHRLAWQPWLIDANRALRALDGVIREHYGAEVLGEMRKTVVAIAQGDAPASNEAERFINRVRTGSTIVGLGWRFTTALMQPSGLAQSWSRVGGSWVAKGVSQYLAAPFETTAWVQSQSDFMKNRASTINREINEILNGIRAGEKLTALEASYFNMIGKMQTTVDIPTWLGARERSLAEQGYENAASAEERARMEKTAIAVADQAVIDSQSDGAMQNLAGVQRGGPMWKLWTNFYSYFSATYNLNVEAYRRTDFSSPSEIGLFLGDMVLLNMVPVLFASALAQLTKGECDWDDTECLLGAYGHQQLSYLFGQMILLRELGSAADVWLGGKSYGYSGPAGQRFFADLYKLGVQANQGEADMAAFKAANAVLGAVLHYPAGQINNTVEGIMAVENGDVEGVAIVPAILFGPPR